MKKISLHIILLLLSMICHSFNELANNVPLLIPTLDNKDIKAQKPIIYDNYLIDSFEVVYTVVVEFRYPFADVDKKILIENVVLNHIKILNLNKKCKSKYISDDIPMDATEKYIWDLCSDKLIEWYKLQPYKDYCYDRSEFIAKKVKFGGALFILQQ